MNWLERCSTIRRRSLWPAAQMSGLWVTKQHRTLPVTVSLDAVADLRAVAETADTIRIGAAATYQDALPVLEKHFPDFGAMIRRIGSPPDPQPRHRRRQHRQRLTDRRHATGLAGAGRVAGAAPRATHDER